MNKKINLYKISQDFILNEGHQPGLPAYIQALDEILFSMEPKTQTDLKRLEVAREHLRAIKKESRRMQEQLKVFESHKCQ